MRELRAEKTVALRGNFEKRNKLFLQVVSGPLPL